MTARTVNTTMDTFFILDTLSLKNKTGMTVGEVAKTQGAMTRGQVQRVLDNLMGAGFIYFDMMPHGRTGKKVYRVAENLAMLCSSIARNYVEQV